MKGPVGLFCLLVLLADNSLLSPFANFSGCSTHKTYVSVDVGGAVRMGLELLMYIHTGQPTMERQ